MSKVLATLAGKKNQKSLMEAERPKLVNCESFLFLFIDKHFGGTGRSNLIVNAYTICYDSIDRVYTPMHLSLV